MCNCKDTASVNGPGVFTPYAVSLGASLRPDVLILRRLPDGGYTVSTPYRASTDTAEGAKYASLKIDDALGYMRGKLEPKPEPKPLKARK